MTVSWKKFFCVDFYKYHLITIFWNSLPMIFKWYDSVSWASGRSLGLLQYQSNSLMKPSIHSDLWRTPADPRNVVENGR